MRVFVYTEQHIDRAFTRRIEEATDKVERDRRRIQQVVDASFRSSPESRMLRAPTGLYCHTLDQWLQAFTRWRDAEIERHPESRKNIERYCADLSALMTTRWPLDAKLLVRECLDDSDDFCSADDGPGASAIVA